MLILNIIEHNMISPDATQVVYKLLLSLWKNHYVNSFPTRSDFCWLLTTFANSLDPDQARRFVGPDLDPICLTLRWCS